MQRFQIEAEAVAKLQHPNIVQIVEMVQEDFENTLVGYDLSSVGYLDSLVFFCRDCHSW